jgi:hypothetical protein
MATYRIIRHFQNSANRTIKKGLTLEEAQAHCQNPETSSTTATGKTETNRTKRYGQWFDGYEEEKAEESYQGYTNYKTWQVGLEMDNDQDSYNYWTKQAKQIYTLSESKEKAVKVLASRMRNWIGKRGVNYTELAEGYIETEIENREYEEVLI